MVRNARPEKAAHEVVTIQAVTTETASQAITVTDGGIRLPIASSYVFILDITNAATDVDDTLDVFISTRINDSSDNWLDVVHFTQVLGNGLNTLQYISKLNVNIAQAEYEVGTALGAGGVRHIIGDAWLPRWVIVDPTGSNVSFTFSITAIPMSN